MSEPQRIGEILPEVMDDIRQRMESRQVESDITAAQKEIHKDRVFCAVADYMGTKCRQGK